MTAFEPPDFSFTGLQFNADIFENPLTETIPDPFPITELNTNNIQAKTLGTPVTLYTNFNDLITLGGSLVPAIVISSLASALAYVTIQTKYFYVASVDGLRSVKTIFDVNIVQEFWADPASSTKTAQITVVPNLITPTIDNTGSYQIDAESLITPNILSSVSPSVNQLLYTTTTAPIIIGTASSSVQILSTSLTTPNTIVSETTGSIQNVFATTTGQIRIGASSSAISLLSNVLANNIGVVDPLSTVVSLFTNFTFGTTSTLAFGNAFLVSLTTKAQSLITYFDTYNLRSNTNANQRIQQTFPSTTTHTQSYFIDNGNSGVETCRVSVSQGSTPLVTNTGNLTLTGGQIGVIGDTVNLSNTGASSVINVNAQLKPAYAYTAGTGVSNPSAIGYTLFGSASIPGLLTSGVNVTRATISIPVDGVYQMNYCNAILSTASSNIIYFRSFVTVFNGSGVYQGALGVSNITFISTIAADVFYMNGSAVFIVTGATALNPFTFNLILSPLFFGAFFASSNNDFRFTVTRIA